MSELDTFSMNRSPFQKANLQKTRLATSNQISGIGEITVGAGLRQESKSCGLQREQFGIILAGLGEQ